MQPYPHTYIASAKGASTGLVAVASPRLPAFFASSPPEFDGPGDVWSPETLLCASIANCFVLTFRAISRPARFEWVQLECRVDGVLERVERALQFTRFTTYAKLTIPAGGDLTRARELLERAEQSCLIANSLRGTRTLQSEVVIEDR